VDLRSEKEDELTRLESALRECVAAGVRDELETSRDRSKGKLEWKLDSLASGRWGTGGRIRRCWRRCARRMNCW
jgi:hypothetical protein